MTLETAVGPVALAWDCDHLTAVQLPGRSKADTVDRLLRRAGGARRARPPTWVAGVARKLCLHLAGRPQEFSAVPLAQGSLPEFHRRVYRLARAVPAGRTVTYGELAHLAGSPKAARAVGQAMANNPFPLVVPCHRVLAASGRIGGFSAYRGPFLKRELLKIEGVDLARGKSGGLFRGTGAVTREAKDAVAHLARVDARLGRLIRRVGPFRLRPHSAASVFDVFAESILYQQLTAKAAATIHERVRTGVGGSSILSPEGVLRVGKRGLRRAGVSSSKARALIDLAHRVVEGSVPPISQLARMSDQEVISSLTSVTGIGRWTVEMVLIFRLGRPDVLPATDYGIRKALALVYALDALPSPAEVEKLGSKWHPFRTFAAWYLWRALELSPAFFGRR